MRSTPRHCGGHHRPHMRVGMGSGRNKDDAIARYKSALDDGVGRRPTEDRDTSQTHDVAGIDNQNLGLRRRIQHSPSRDGNSASTPVDNDRDVDGAARGQNRTIQGNQLYQPAAGGAVDLRRHLFHSSTEGQVRSRQDQPGQLPRSQRVRVALINLGLDFLSLRPSRAGTGSWLSRSPGRCRSVERGPRRPWTRAL